MQNMSLLKNISNSAHVADGVIGACSGWRRLHLLRALTAVQRVT